MRERLLHKTKPFRLVVTTLVVSAMLSMSGCRQHADAPTVVAVDATSSESNVPQSAEAIAAENHAPDSATNDAGPVQFRNDSDTAVNVACTQEQSSPHVTPHPTQFRQGEVPVLQHRVTDETGVLTEDCIADLTERLAALERDTGTQLAVLLVPSLQDDTIESVATRVFDQWKLGQKRADNGLLLVAALNDHRARIEVGYGLEQFITDATAGDILRADLKENFAAMRYNAGVSAVVDSLAERVRNKTVAPPQPPPPAHRHNGSLGFLAAVLFACVVFGGVAEALKLRWLWRVPFVAALGGLAMVAGTPLGLTTGYAVAIPMIPLSLIASCAGIPFVRDRRQAFQWVTTCVAVMLVLDVILFAVSRTRATGYRNLDVWIFAAATGGLILGSILFFIVKIMRGATWTHGTSTPYDDRDSSSSSSSSSDSDSSSSSSSDSSFSGGGGESGGGGASTSW